MKRARRAATEPSPLRVAVVGAGSIGCEKAVEHFGHATNTVVTVVSLIVIGFVIVAGGAEVDSNNWYVCCNSRKSHGQSD